MWKVIFSFIIVVTLLLGAGLFWAYRNPDAVQHAIFNEYLKKIQPHLPFQVESFHVSKFKEGFDFSVKLNYKNFHFDFSGPLKINRLQNQDWGVDYQPQTKVEIRNDDGTAEKGAETSPFLTHLLLVIPKKLDGVGELSLQLSDQKLEWPIFGVKSEKFEIAAHWKANEQKSDIQILASTSTLAWANPKKSDQAINATQLHFEISVPIQLHPLSVDKKMDVVLRLKGCEVLNGKTYFDLDLSQAPIHFSTPDFNSFTSEVGKHEEFKLAGERLALSDETSRLKLEWKTKELPFASLYQYVEKAFSLGALRVINPTQGRLTTKGTAIFSKGKTETSLHDLNMQVTGRDFQFRTESGSVAAKGISFSLPISLRRGIEKGSIEAEQFFFKHFNGSLKKTLFSLTPTRREGMREGPYRLEVKNPLPLQLVDLPLSIGPISGTVGKNPDNPNSQSYDLKTTMKLAPVSFKPFATGLCSKAQIPPSTIELNFSSLRISSEIVDPDGQIKVKIFKGEIEIDEIAGYDLLSAVPEFDFDLKWSGIDMQTMGDWVDFGEIKGTLEGYAHDVVFQSFFPTRYNFMTQILPLDKRALLAHVEFSPTAMKNFVKIFTGESLEDQIPGVAGWLAFGWPSRVFGGYDVYYAGISLVSSNGLILLETLDKPSILETERKHFVLYGPRFKMPLRNSHYPLVLDATSMGNFVHHLVVQLKAMKAEKDRKLKVLKHSDIMKSPDNPDDSRGSSNESDEEEQCLAP